MGSTNYGDQLLQFMYKDPLNAAEFNRRNTNIIDPGVYNGGLISIVNDTSVTLATFVIEITDGTYNVRINTTSSVTVTVSTSNVYVIARYTYSGQVNWYADVIAVNQASLQANDIIFGKCIYTGSTLTSIDYNEKTNPMTLKSNTINTFLEPSYVDGQLYIAVASGKFSYGGIQKTFAGGNSPAMAAPSANPRIDLVYIDSSAVLQVVTGSEAASPTPPTHSGRLTIAEVYLEVGDTQIDSEDITDVRPWLTPIINANHDHADDFSGGNTLTTPTIGDFTNANHGHEDTAGGGGLSFEKLTLTGVAASPPDANTLVKDNVVKAWLTFSGQGVIAIQDSYNVSSIVDNGIGDYGIFWDTDFANINPACFVGVYDNTAVLGGGMVIGNAPTVTKITIRTANLSTDLSYDFDLVYVMAIGDQ